MRDKKVDAADSESDQPDPEATNARRRFLGKAGKVAVTTTAVTLMLSAGTKRGAHLSLTLERLEALCETPPQRIGLSATQRPLEETARFLGGHDGDAWRPVTIVDAGIRKPLDLEIVVPIEDMGDLGSVVNESVSGPASAGPVRKSIWPSIHPRLLDLI